MESNHMNSLNSLCIRQGEDTNFNSINPLFDFEKISIEVDDFETEAEQLIKQGNEAKESKGLFTVKTANRWIEQAKTRPIPKMLFGEFWFEGELCILFADTNLGKSILAVQIGNSISRSEQIRGFQLQAEKQPILYCDFELTDKQFENRYSVKFEQHYIWDKNFLRVEINPDAEIPENQIFEKFLNDSLEHSIIETGAKVLIIDNLTYLKNETEKAKDALPLMKHLKALKNKYGLSILALAHTPKRDLSKPITRNDLQGSKMLINFCDSSFAIGESSNDKNIRYIKQIKARNTEIIYDTENVCICHIEKPNNFLQFEFLNFGTEREHLKQISESEKSEIENSIKVLLQAEPSLTAYAIAKRLCPDESKFNSFKVKVSRIVNRISNNSNT
jgi:RecA-family ATPase